MTRKKSDPLADSLISSLLDDAESDADINLLANVNSPGKARRSRRPQVNSENHHSPSSENVTENTTPQSNQSVAELNFANAKFQGQTVVHKLSKLDAKQVHASQTKSFTGQFADHSESLQPGLAENLLPREGLNPDAVAVPEFGHLNKKGKGALAPSSSAAAANSAGERSKVALNESMQRSLAERFQIKKIPAEPKPQGPLESEQKLPQPPRRPGDVSNTKTDRHPEEKTVVVSLASTQSSRPLNPPGVVESETISKTQNVVKRSFASGNASVASGTGGGRSPGGNGGHGSGGGHGGPGSGSGSSGSGSDDGRGSGSGRNNGAGSALDRAQQLLHLQTYAQELSQRVEELEISKVRQDNEIFSLKKRWFELKSEKEELDNLLLNERERFKSELERRDIEIKAQKRKIEASLESMEERERDLQSQFRRLIASEARLKDRLNSQQAEHRAVLKEKEKRLRDLEMLLEEMRDEKDLSSQESRRHSLRLKEQQESVRRAVRAMRMALQSLDGNESMKSDITSKKTG